MTGGLLVLAAYSAQNEYVSGNLGTFLAVYRRYTNFSILSISIFTGGLILVKKFIVI